MIFSSAKYRLLTTVAGACLAAPAMAQSSADSEEDTVRPIEEVIVTGRAGISQITQFESSTSITTFGETAIEDAAPLTLADLYADVPGVWAESSGGQSAANVFIRGIPAPGQFLFSKINVDGLPVFEEHGIGFLTPDGLLRIDPTIQRVEAVRGGASAVFASNAPGGIFNHITKRGTPTPEGSLRFEWGDFGHYRFDGVYSGPISDNTSFSIGGFYRVADGVRDPGFRGDEGGQIRGSITHTFERGEFTVTAGYVNDRNIFYLPIPLDLDENGGFTDVPGIDANTGTLISDDVRFVSLLRPGGVTEEFDLADGIHNEAANVGTEFIYEINDTFTVTNRNRYMDGDIQFNSAIPFGFEASELFLQNQLGAAQDAFGDDVTEVIATFSDDGTMVPTNNQGNGLIGNSGFFAVNSNIDNFVNDLQLSAPFDTDFGTHNFTLGFYTSFYSVDQTQGFSGYVHEIANSPRNIDLTAVDATGTALGTLTLNGFSNYASNFFQQYSGDGEVYAFYLSDEWEVTSDLRFDIGLRYEHQTLDGTAAVPASFDLSDNNPLLNADDLPTTADDMVFGPSGQFLPFSESYDEFSFSVGGNYVVTNSIAVFGRVSDGFRTPNLDDLAGAALGGATSDVPVADVFQGEGGLKVSLPWMQAFVTGFYSEVDNQPFNEPVRDNAGNVIEALIVQSSETVGLEAEVDVGPFAGFSVNAKLTLQDPDLTGLSVQGGADIDVDDAFLSGNRVPRIPSRLILVRPRYEVDLSDFSELEGQASIFLDIYHAGRRFQDFNNTIRLPSYTTLSLGARIALANGLDLALTVDNLTNAVGLTEGNPRGDLFAPGGGDITVATFGRPIVGRNYRLSLGYSF